MSAFEAVIGLEVHVQLSTKSKLFCACPTTYGLPPNSATCPTCLGLPGALPTLNAEAVRMAIRLGRALEARIQPRSTFYRKQYFYADLPKGYQITQGPVALVEEGTLRLPGDAAVRGAVGPIACGIERAHLEEDAGKSNHELREGASLVDLNRAGLALLEIVGRPDLRSPVEAMEYLKGLHRLVTFLGICDGNMEEGSFRCDANVSLRPVGTEAFGTRVEIKNLNSFNNVRRALEFEMARQGQILEAGGSLSPETRGWDADKGETRPQRSKEGAHDYRFFPEPDLLPLVIDPAELEGPLPELPEAKARRFMADHGLSEFEAITLLQSRAFAGYFEALAAASGHAKASCNWMLGEVSRHLNDQSLEIGAFPVAPEALGALVRLVEARVLNLATAKEAVFPALLKGERDPAAFVAAQGLGQVSDRGAIEELVRGVIAANGEALAQFKGGRANLRGFFVGQAMKAGGGKLDPRLVNEVLDAELAKA